MNSDIEVLNANQDKIIEYIHTNFNADPHYQSHKKNSRLDIQFESDSSDSSVSKGDSEEEFMEAFRVKVRHRKIE